MHILLHPAAHLQRLTTAHLQCLTPAPAQRLTPEQISNQLMTLPSLPPKLEQRMKALENLDKKLSLELKQMKERLQERTNTVLAPKEAKEKAIPDSLDTHA